MIFEPCPKCDSHKFLAELLEHTHEVPELQDKKYTCGDCGHTETRPPN